MIPMKKCSILSRAKWCRLFQPYCRDAGAKQVWGVTPGVAMRFIAASNFCLIAGLLGSFAHADRRVISLQGGCIAPSAPNENIRLDVMHVTFRSKRDTYSVDARYRLFNTGETTTVTVGVPKYGRPDRDEPSYYGEPVVRDFIAFDAWVNGRNAEFVEVRDFTTDPSARPVVGYYPDGNQPKETRWMKKRITFTGKATTTIRVRYEAHYHNYYFHSGILVESGYYHDSVGRYWNDKIKRATFVSDITDINGAVCGWCSYGGRVALTNFISVDEIRQWEPSSDSCHGIDGSWEGAKWRKWGPFGPWFGRGGHKAPTPCNIDWDEFLKGPLNKK
ncbi:hypothetical protein ACFL2Q_17350 [Thermodesulfobacteriota bacterium]